MADDRIVAVRAREILDSKARPMVEVDVWTAGGVMGRGASPCGTSVGRHEAFVLRDGGTRYGGLGVRQAVTNVIEIISPAIRGKSALDQRAIDELMIELDGTPNKSRLGANAIYSASIGVARAAANALRVPLYRYLGGPEANLLPVPMFNMVNGGTHATTRVEFQEFLLIPAAAKTYSEALQAPRRDTLRPRANRPRSWRASSRPQRRRGTAGSAGSAWTARRATSTTRRPVATAGEEKPRAATSSSRISRNWPGRMTSS